MDKVITVLSLSIGIIGLFATLTGSYFTYISFINPLVRFKRYLKDSEGWEKFLGVEKSITRYRYKKHPNFQIVVDWDNVVAEDFNEEWMAYTLDDGNNASYHVRLEVNGMVLEKELFLSLDGHRYFVPVPKTMTYYDGDSRSFYYRPLQIQLANIIGDFYRGNNIYDFIREQRMDIPIMQN